MYSFDIVFKGKVLKYKKCSTQHESQKRVCLLNSLVCIYTVKKNIKSSFNFTFSFDASLTLMRDILHLLLVVSIG